MTPVVLIYPSLPVQKVARERAKSKIEQRQMKAKLEQEEKDLKVRVWVGLGTLSSSSSSRAMKLESEQLLKTDMCCLGGWCLPAGEEGRGDQAAAEEEGGGPAGRGQGQAPRPMGPQVGRPYAEQLGA